MAQSKPVHLHDRTRFIRLFLVTIEELTPLLQDILKNEISPSQIFYQVSHDKPLFKKLKAEQITLIQNAQNDGYTKFDITLVYTLLRNLSCINITAPTQGWGKLQMPGHGEITLGDDIERIRLIRNRIVGHPAAPALSETEFKEYWSNLVGIYKRMGTFLGKNYLDRLLNAEIRTIDMEMESIYLEKFRNMCADEKSMRELIQEIVQGREETVRIEVRNPQKRKHAETLTDTSISILNCMKDCITDRTSEADLELLYESVEETISENKEDTRDGNS